MRAIKETWLEIRRKFREGYYVSREIWEKAGLPVGCKRKTYKLTAAKSVLKQLDKFGNDAEKYVVAKVELDLGFSDYHETRETYSSELIALSRFTPTDKQQETYWYFLHDIGAVPVLEENYEDRLEYIREKVIAHAKRPEREGYEYKIERRVIRTAFEGVEKISSNITYEMQDIENLKKLSQ